MDKLIKFFFMLFDWTIVRKSLYKSMVNQSSIKDNLIKELEKTIYSLRENNLRLHNEIVAKENVIDEHVKSLWNPHKDDFAKIPELVKALLEETPAADKA